MISYTTRIGRIVLEYKKKMIIMIALNVIYTMWARKSKRVYCCNNFVYYCQPTVI